MEEGVYLTKTEQFTTKRNVTVTYIIVLYRMRAGCRALYPKTPAWTVAEGREPVVLFQAKGFLERRIAPRPTMAALIAAVSLAVVSACSTGATEVPPTQAPDDEFVAARNAMVDAYGNTDEISDPLVLTAMRTVRRQEFVLPRDRARAYREMALAINAGQTISQPFVVALMTDLLDLQPGERVLEIGTGSGYQGAVLAEITDHVYSIEIIPSLAAEVDVRLDRLGYGDIALRQADGYFGWEEQAPFDGIIVTAAPDHVPPPLLRQLADGGKMVIPVGPPGAVQTLWLIERRGDDYIRINQGAVRFVPFTREP